MDKKNLAELFRTFLIGEYDSEKQQRIWRDQSNTFKNFWKNKMLSADARPLPETDYDHIIRLIDKKARGFNSKTDEAVAHVGITQGTWYRIFNDLKRQSAIRTTLDTIFSTEEEGALVDLINRLEKENEENKNGLTGKHANALNALLFLNRPDKFLSVVSLDHRFQILNAFGFSDPATYKTYGEKVILSNRDILRGFRSKFDIEVDPRTISQALYLVPGIRMSWRKENADKGETETEEANASQTDFGIEKHLEDFLIENWESTELGKRYNLIEENGEPVSQQYQTDIGRIDLLVRDRQDGGYLVIELKKGQASDDTVGQLARYMTWVRKHIANGGKVQGIIIAKSDDQGLRYALESLPNSALFLYRIKFELEKLM